MWDGIHTIPHFLRLDQQPPQNFANDIFGKLSAKLDLGRDFIGIEAFAAEVLGEMGYGNVESLRAGFTAWVAEGGDVE